MKDLNQFSNQLIRWHLRHGRHDLPWQRQRSAYRIWISEIMLQQTQVVTVIDYFQRFIRRFPSLKQLAQASQDEVLAHWSGLGYYARARNLHKAAQHIYQDHNGRFPKKLEMLITLPGIGRSTAGAILSFAFNAPTAICDGNVKRVLARFFAIDTPKQSSKAIKHFWQLAEQLTPTSKTALYNQAIMDLGATVCTRTKPQCTQCPLQADCQAYQAGNPTAYPVSPKRQTKPTRSITMLLIQANNGQILLEKRPQSGIWAGLWSFIESSNTPTTAWLNTQFGNKMQSHTVHSPIPHEFTHFKLMMHPLHIFLEQPMLTQLSNNPTQWYDFSQINSLGVPSALKKIIHLIN